MGLPELIDAFERDTATELAAIRTAAAADVYTIDAEAARARAERIASAAAATAITSRARADSAVAEAIHRARGVVYERRAAMLQRLRTEVERQLAVMLDEATSDALLRVALACAGDEPGVLRCTPSIASRARVLAPASLPIAADETIVAGVVVELVSGTRIDATLARLLERDWPRLSGEAVQVVAREAP